jgi:hypothetical protein
MDVTLFLNILQLILAFCGIVVSVIWYLLDKRRIRYSPFLWGMWCLILIIYRTYRFTDPNSGLIHSSLASLLFMLGIVNVIFMGITNIVEVRKHGLH